MRRLLVLLSLASAFAVPAAQAHGASAPKGPTAAQFKALQTEVKTLETTVKKLQTELQGVEVVTSALLACQTAVIADEFQATWNVVDQISSATQAGKTYFGPQTSISDANACAVFKFTRASAMPPTVAIFSSLVSLLSS